MKKIFISALGGDKTAKAMIVDNQEATLAYQFCKENPSTKKSLIKIYNQLRHNEDLLVKAFGRNQKAKVVIIDNPEALVLYRLCECQPSIKEALRCCYAPYNSHNLNI